LEIWRIKSSIVEGKAMMDYIQHWVYDMLYGNNLIGNNRMEINEREKRGDKKGKNDT
jgi:hypothetical protein